MRCEFYSFIPDLPDLVAVTFNSARDIDPFALALSDRAAYNLMYPGIDAELAGSLNGHMKLNNLDIDYFGILLVGGSAAPEPSVTVLLGAAGVIVLVRGRFVRARQGSARLLTSRSGHKSNCFALPCPPSDGFPWNFRRRPGPFFGKSLTVQGAVASVVIRN